MFKTQYRTTTYRLQNLAGEADATRYFRVDNNGVIYVDNNLYMDAADTNPYRVIIVI